MCVEYALQALDGLGVRLAAGCHLVVAALAEQCGVHVRHHRLLGRMLGMLAEEGFLEAVDDGWLVRRKPHKPRADSRLAGIRKKFGDKLVLPALVAQCGRQLARVLRNECDPLQLLFPQDSPISAERLYRDAPASRVLGQTIADLIGKAVRQVPPGRPLRVLEIGAGTGGTTSFVVPNLPADRVAYTFTDVSAMFVSAARKAYAGYGFMEYAVLDITREPAEQGFELQAYDVVVAANVLHATPDLKRTLANVKSLLAPHGWLVLQEGTAPRRWLDLTFGLLDGWWAFADDRLQSSYPLLSQERWTALLSACGFEGPTAIPAKDADASLLDHQSIILAQVPSSVASQPDRLAAPDGAWLVMSDQGGVGRRVATALRSRGARCMELHSDDRDRLDSAMAEATAVGALKGVVYLWGLDLEGDDIGLPSALLGGSASPVDDVLRLVRKLTGRQAVRAPGLWVVSRGVQPLGKAGGAPALAQSLLWGLGQVIGMEYPDLWRGLVDLDPAGGSDEHEWLADELLADAGEELVALRGGMRLVARLTRRANTAAQDTLRFDPDGVFLVTGGLGDAGLQLATWMVDRGARKFFLVGRTGLPPRDTWSALDSHEPRIRKRIEGVLRLEARGATVEVFAADVADLDGLDAILNNVRIRHGSIRGVVHAAGLPGFKPISDLNEADWFAVMAPKAIGAWHLHRLTLHDPLDFFVCFSSASSVLGARGQGHYAAANRFLDALVHYRRAHGLPGLSVNWGRWGFKGMLTAEAHRDFAQIGLQSMKPDAATEALGTLIASKAAQVMVAAVDWRVFKPLYQARRRRPLLDRIEIADVTTTADEGRGRLARLMDDTPPSERRRVLADEVERQVASVLGLRGSRRIDPQAGLFELGMDSLMAVTLRGKLQTAIDRELPKTLAFEHPTVAALTDFLLAQHESPSGPVATSAPTVKPAAATAAPQVLGHEPIAIIGLGCRFPGGVNDPESFWQLLHNGVDAVGEVPPDRWGIKDYFDPDPNAPGKMYCKDGGFIDGVAEFDPQFFGIAPREAAAMDPQHRLLLETAWEAIERAGCSPVSLRGSRSGVFFGLTANDYSEILARHVDPDAYYITGNSPNAAAGRLSYLLGLHGPSMVVDAACASSLVAVHLACRSLRQGECELALAGGVNLILSPRGTIAACRSKMLSPSGRCRTFDASADGFVRGEGCGVVVLKRLSDAIAARDPILAVIRGTAVGQDGASGGLTVPNASAQAAVVREALGDAAVAPSDVDYIEAHGTGTSLGDPIEVRALASVFEGTRREGRPLLLGSVKTNIGHLESASGIAGLIKTILAMQHTELPPHLHLTELNPAIPLNVLPAIIPTEGLPWPRLNNPRVAGVSSFGASGTLAHVVVEEAPAASSVTTDAEATRSSLLCLSARTPEALASLIRLFRGHLGSIPDSAFADVCYTANTGRAHFEYRLAIVAASRVDAMSKLDRVLAGATPVDVYRGERVEPRLEAAVALDGDASDRAIELGRLAQSYVAGATIDWSSLYAVGSYRRVVLPTYPFQRQRYWPREEGGRRESWRESTGQVRCPLLGRRLQLPTTRDIHFESHVSAESPSWLSDHRVLDEVVLPATAYLEMALSAGTEVLGDGCILDEVSISHPMAMSDFESRRVQCVLAEAAAQERSFQVFSRPADLKDDSEWQLHAGGRIRRLAPGQVELEETLRVVRARCTESLSVDGYYRGLKARGLMFGDDFRGIVALWRGHGEALGHVRLAGHLASEAADYRMHPALLDACSQVVGAALASAGGGDLYLLVRAEGVEVSVSGCSEAWCRAVPLPDGSSGGDRLRATLTVYETGGRVVARVAGMEYQRVSPQAVRALLGQAGGRRGAPGGPRGGNGLLRALVAARHDQREPLLQSHIRREAARILGLDALPDPRAGFFDIGMDSLTATELKDALQYELDRPLPATLVFEYGTPKSLATFLAGEMAGVMPAGGDESEAVTTSGPGTRRTEASRTETHAELDGLSAEQMAELFAKAITEIKGDRSG